MLKQIIKTIFPNLKVEKVREYFRPTVKRDEAEKYPPLIKTKLSQDKVKVWTQDKTATTAEAIQKHSEMQVVVMLRSVYFQSKNWGVTLEVLHVKLGNKIDECPFSDSE